MPRSSGSSASTRNPSRLLISGSVDAATDTAALTAAIAALPATLGGIIELGGAVAGGYKLTKPFILPDRTWIQGQAGAGNPIIFPDSTFPTATAAGAQTFPITTLTLTAMPANAPSSGVVSVVTAAGPQWITYTGKSGVTLTGCLSVTGTGTVADLSAVGWPMFMLGDPVNNADGAFSCGIERVQIYLSTDATQTNRVPGMIGVYSNRIQEFSGLRDVGIINIARAGIVIEPKPTGDTGITAQNWDIARVYLISAAASAEATGRGFSIHGGRQPHRAIRGITVSAHANVQSTAGFTAGYVSGFTGEISDAQLELVTTGIYLDNTGAAGTRNGPIVLSNIYGGSGITTVIRNTTVAGHDEPYSFRNIRRVSGVTNLIVDDITGLTSTDIDVNKHEIGRNISSYRNIDSDLLAPSIDDARRLNGLLGWSSDPFNTSTQTLVPAVATLYLVKIPLRRAISITNVITYLNVVGAGTLTHCYGLLYSSAGVVIGQSADKSVAWSTGGTLGVQTMPLVGGPFTVTPANPSDFVWVGVYIGTNSGGALPKFQLPVGAGALLLNVNLAVSVARSASIAIADTATPGNITPASLTAASFPFLAMLS